MLATDNHVGLMERDPVRGDDSFRTFEEIFQIAKRNQVDMVLLGGDLFHYNQPSRKTMHDTVEIFKRYCLGDDPVQFQVVSHPASTFRSTRFVMDQFTFCISFFNGMYGHVDTVATSKILIAILDFLCLLYMAITMIHRV